MYFETTKNFDKPSILMFHGAMFARSLEKLRHPLSKDFNLIFAHMDGHGQENESRFERSSIIDQTISFVKSKKLKPHLFGFSLGSQIVLSLADKYSDNFDKVALVSPLIDAEKSDIATIKFQMKALAAMVKFKPFAKIASSVLKLKKDATKVFYKEQKGQDVTQLADDIMKKGLNLSDLPNLPNLKNEFFIATGLKDAPYFVKSAVTLKKVVPNCVLSTYAQCGHNIPITCHKKLSMEIINFYKY